MTRLGGWGQPGSGAIATSQEAEILWGDQGERQVLTQSVLVDAATVDASATVTTELRAGLILGQLTTNSQLTEWDGNATDGSEHIFGVLGQPLSMIDAGGTTADRVVPVIVRAPLKASFLLVEGAALVGHADEYLARRMLHGMGCILDDDPQGFLAGAGARQATKAASYTVLVAENGMTFIATAAATFTLPTIAAGLKYQFRNGADTTMVVTSGTTDMIGVDNASRTSITFSTASELIGAGVNVEAISAAGTLKWWTALASSGELITPTFA